MRLTKNRVLLAFACALIASATAFANRGITPEDYFAFHFLNDAHLSPDGKQVAYVMTLVDQQRNRRSSSVWVVPTDGRSAPRRITAQNFNSTAPRWSPDGLVLAFLSNRAGETAAPATPAPANPATPAAGVQGDGARPQICLLSMSGGEAQVISHLKNGVTSYQWSPDGKRFAALTRTGPSDAIAPGARKSDVRHYQHLSYKFNDTGWYDDKRSHIWILDAATGKEQQLTSGDDWNDLDPQWSPDSTRVAFVSNRTGHEYDEDHNRDVWVIAATGGPLTKISDHPFEDDMPRWSADGTKILFAGQTKRREFAKLYIAPATGGVASELITQDLDLIPGALHWGPGPNQVRFETGFHGTEQMFRVDLAAHKTSQVTKGERAVHGVDINEKAGLMSYLSNDFDHMDDVYVSAL